MFDKSRSFPFFPIIKNTSRSDYIPLNLSIKSSEIPLEVQKYPEEMEEKVIRFLANKNGTVAYGGYLEKRALYDRSDHFGSTIEKRNIHLGTDFWCKKDSIISCPLNAVVHSFRNNNNFGDYGPTIILEHSDIDHIFYTLYGHLSSNSIKNINIGDIFNKGEDLARVGNHKENGNYAPHLHFQVILDIEDFTGDYPGVVSKENLEYYTNKGIDPKILLGL